MSVKIAHTKTERKDHGYNNLKKKTCFTVAGVHIKIKSHDSNTVEPMAKDHPEHQQKRGDGVAQLVLFVCFIA